MTPWRNPAIVPCSPARTTAVEPSHAFPSYPFASGRRRLVAAVAAAGLVAAGVDRPEGDAGSPTDLDRRVLGLLLAGLTDQVVAAQLGLSLRTLQRRLRYLMDPVGVQTRMQLGWHAARHGWL